MPKPRGGGTFLTVGLAIHAQRLACASRDDAMRVSQCLATRKGTSKPAGRVSVKRQARSPRSKTNTGSDALIGILTSPRMRHCVTKASKGFQTRHGLPARDRCYHCVRHKAS